MHTDISFNRLPKTPTNTSWRGQRSVRQDFYSNDCDRGKRWWWLCCLHNIPYFMIAHLLTDRREANETVTVLWDCDSILSPDTYDSLVWCAVRLFRETDLYLSGRKITLNIIGARAAQQRRPRVYYDAVQERFKLYLDADTRAVKNGARSVHIQIGNNLTRSRQWCWRHRRRSEQFSGQVPSGMYKQSVVRDMHFRLAWRYSFGSSVAPTSVVLWSSWQICEDIYNTFWAWSKHLQTKISRSTHSSSQPNALLKQSFHRFFHELF